MTGGERRRHRPPRENALLALLRIPVFRRVWAAIAFSSLGDWLGLLANTALAQQLTREQSLSTQGAAISGVILVRLAPDLLFGPFAAALSDKLDRRKTVIVGDLFVGVLYASIAFGYNLLWLYVAQFVIEATGLFTQPCKQVIWVAIVPKRLLPTANQISLFSVYGTVPIAAGLFAVLSTVDRLVSGGGSGGVHVSIVVALLLNTVTFVVSATTIFLSRREIPVAPQAREQQEGIFGLLREGIAFVRHDPLIRGLYVGIIGAFAGGGLVVGVAQPWVLTLNAGTAGYSIMFGVVFTGLALGMLLGPRVLPSYRRNRVFGLAIGAAGLTLFGASVIRDFVLAVVLAAFVGFFSGMAWIIGYTLIGQEVEDRLRGRVFAFVLSSVRLILLLTIAVGPNLAGLFGTHAIRAGRDSYLILSGPGLTLLLGGVLALGVSFYATSRAGGQRRRLRDAVRRRLLKSTAGHRERPGLFVTVDGLDPAATARYAALVAEVARQRSMHVVETAEPTAPLGGDADADARPGRRAVGRRARDRGAAVRRRPRRARRHPDPARARARRVRRLRPVRPHLPRRPRPRPGRRPRPHPLRQRVGHRRAHRRPEPGRRGGRRGARRPRPRRGAARAGGRDRRRPAAPGALRGPLRPPNCPRRSCADWSGWWRGGGRSPERRGPRPPPRSRWPRRLSPRTAPRRPRRVTTATAERRRRANVRTPRDSVHPPVPDEEAPCSTP